MRGVVPLWRRGPGNGGVVPLMRGVAPVIQGVVPVIQGVVSAAEGRVLLGARSRGHGGSRSPEGRAGIGARRRRFLEKLG